MPISTVEDFLALLDKSKLLGGEPLAEAHRLAEQAADPTSLAKTLIQAGRLSRWQAGRLLAGCTAFFIGKYRLIQLLGRGGMGSVFLAEHVTMNRRVALKILPRQVGKDPASLQRFLGEARAIAALDHPNIVQAYSVDNECDRYYIVMEFVAGLDLQQMVEAEGPLDFQRAADYIRQAADGLAHAHARKMVHCDVKPSNLLVNQQGVVKVLDLGLARLTTEGDEEGVQPDEQVLGTVDYQAPEQALGGPDFDHRADIYSLGCTLYFLLTGHPPFPDGTLAQRIVKHQTQEPRDILEDRPDAPVDLVNICRRMMAKKAEDRFQSAQEVSQALAAWEPPARTAEPLPPLTVAQPLEDDLPVADAGTNAWWNAVVSTAANSSGAIPVVRASPGPLLTPLPKAPVRPERPPASVLSWCNTPGRKVAAGMAAAAAVALVLTTVGGAIILMAGRNPPSHPNGVVNSNGGEKETADPSTTKNSPPVPPGTKTPDVKGKPPPQQAEKKTEKGKTVEEPSAKPPEAEKPKKKKRGGKGGKKGGKNKPVQPAPEPEKPTPEPEKPKPQPEKPKGPLDDLSKTVNLPALAEVAVTAGQVVALSPIHLGPDASMQVVLVSGESTSKTVPRFALRSADTDGQRHHWIVAAEPQANLDVRKKADVARLSVEKDALTFQWLATAAAAQGNYLRNCGLLLSVGDEKRFLPLRAPKEVEPLVVDLDQGPPRKGINERMLLGEYLPAPTALRLQLLSLDAFPKHELRPVGSSGPRTDVLAAGGDLEIVFTQPQLSLFALRVSFVAKPGEMGVRVAPLHLPLDDSYADRYEPFAPGEAARHKEQLQRRIGQFKMPGGRPAGKQKRPTTPQAGAYFKQLQAFEAQLEQLDALYKALKKTAVIQFRVFVPLDEEHAVDLFRTSPPPR